MPSTEQLRIPTPEERKDAIQASIVALENQRTGLELQAKLASDATPFVPQLQSLTTLIGLLHVKLNSLN